MNEKMTFKVSEKAGCGCGPKAAGGTSCCAPQSISPQSIRAVQAKLTPPPPFKMKPVSRVGSAWTVGDYWGAFKVRWGIRRMNYIVEPGLYALGEPNSESEVLVTANYKLTFDTLRHALSGRSFWLLVLDTKGVNVWCAAGKGTFGTDELVSRIRAAGLERVVSHRRVIVPQLGAPGVAAHVVQAQTGFKVVYGPIEAADISAFVDAERKALPSMREKRFPLRERVVLIPMELVAAFKAASIIVAGLLLLAGLTGPVSFIENMILSGVPVAAAFLSALLVGAVLTPVLLPYLPGRAFSLKSLPLGIGAGIVVALIFGNGFTNAGASLESSAWLLIVPSLSAYLAMNFTGASTYTSLSGVKREMKLWLPAQISATALGLTLWIGSRFVA